MMWRHDSDTRCPSSFPWEHAMITTSLIVSAMQKTSAHLAAAKSPESRKALESIVDDLAAHYLLVLDANDVPMIEIACPVLLQFTTDWFLAA
jgi:hypothetical protein